MDQVLVRPAGMIGPATRPQIPVGQDLGHSYILPTSRFSFSQFKLEKQCAACYEQRYVYGHPSVLRPVMAVGRAIHGALSAGRLALIAGRSVNVGELKDFAAEAFDAAYKGLRSDGTEPEDEPIRKLGKSDKDWGQVKDNAVRVAEATVPLVLTAEASHTVLAVEASVDFDGVFPFPFAGYVDRWLDDASWATAGHVGDDKVVAKDEPPDDWVAWQVTTYTLPWRLSGERMEGGVNQHIKTKTPAVHLWTEKGYTFEPTIEQCTAVYEMILASARRISAGRFEPGPHPWGCDTEHARYPRFGIVVPEVAA